MSALLAACASASPDSVGQLNGDRQVCIREVRIGTMLPASRCRTAAQAEQERVEAEKVLNFTRQQGTEGVTDRIGR